MVAKTAITPTRSEDYPKWYQKVIQVADLAENSPVRGCMTIKPYGYAIWENMQQILDAVLKQTGHQNAYFPLLIPVKFLEKEAEHVEGFAKECAIVTHSRLVNKNGKLIPGNKLEEPLVIRPTSETIIGECFSRWIQSYRDLPLLINQWANIMRWEMRTRLFLRTSEFLWQEGHTAHATADEAIHETLKILDVYVDFAENTLAIPVIAGIKTPDEKFPGADKTYCIEAMMQDKKALQAGTSHFLGQNFAKASDITFTTKSGAEEYAWTTSWGVTTRLIGGLIMTHADDDGLVLPPKIAPYQIAIIPIYKNTAEMENIIDYCNNLTAQLSEILFNKQTLKILIDNRELTSGQRSWDAIKKGIPVRIEIGPKDLASNTIVVKRRDQNHRDKQILSEPELLKNIADILLNIQNNLLTKAKKLLNNNIKIINNQQDFIAYFKQKNPGFVKCFSCHNDAIQKLTKDLQVSARCTPLAEINATGKCIFTNQENSPIIIYGKAY